MNLVVRSLAELTSRKLRRSNFGDVPSLVRLLSSHGFLISSHDNDGIQVRPESPTVNYVYCARAELKSRAQSVRSTSWPQLVAGAPDPDVGVPESVATVAWLPPERDRCAAARPLPAAYPRS
jgi:hypothetical protein